MKQKYRIVEKRYNNGDVWFMPQVGDWWHGWRYLCKPHPCPDVEMQRITYRTFDEADAYMKDLIERNKKGETSPCRQYVFAESVKIHNYTHNTNVENDGFIK